MGSGGVAALGCTIGQGVTGVSTLSVGSFLAIASIFGGARLGLWWLVKGSTNRSCSPWEFEAEAVRKRSSDARARPSKVDLRRPGAGA